MREEEKEDQIKRFDFQIMKKDEFV